MAAISMKMSRFAFGALDAGGWHERSGGSGYYTSPATRPAAAAVAVDAEIAGVLKSPTTTEQKMLKLIELADAVSRR